MKRSPRTTCGGVALVVIASLLTGCLDVLDGPVYRPRGDVVSIDAADVNADHAIDARDVPRMDTPHAETTPPDTLPPVDVADEPIATEDAVDAVDATTDVMEIEASFSDGGFVDVILPTDVLPDIPCPPCRAGQSCCAGICVNLSLNEQNCGGCGVVCPAPGVCQSGACGRCTLGLLCGAEQRCCVGSLLCIGLLCPP